MVTEANIERAVCDYARKKGWLVKKLQTAGTRGSAGWPDRLFISPTGRCVFIEFKRPGGKLTVLQSAILEDLKSRGCATYVVDNVLYGMDVLNGEAVA